MLIGPQEGDWSKIHRWLSTQGRGRRIQEEDRLQEEGRANHIQRVRHVIHCMTQWWPAMANSHVLLVRQVYPTSGPRVQRGMQRVVSSELSARLTVFYWAAKHFSSLSSLSKFYCVIEWFVKSVVCCQAFQFIDQDKDGFISKNDIRASFDSLGMLWLIACSHNTPNNATLFWLIFLA